MHSSSSKPTLPVKCSARSWQRQLPTTSLESISGSWRTCPTCWTNNQQSDLVHLVKTELGVDNLKLCGRSNFKGDNYPILDALSCKLGISLRHILAPPTTSCLLCGKDLVSNHKPSQVPLHSVNGPLIASKYGWECKGCRGAGQFRVGQPVSRCFNILIFASKQKKHQHSCIARYWVGVSRIILSWFFLRWFFTKKKIL